MLPQVRPVTQNFGIISRKRNKCKQNLRMSQPFCGWNHPSYLLQIECCALVQAVNVFGQFLPVIILLRRADLVIRIRAAVDVVEGAVL